MNRRDFPILKTVTYLDASAGTLKPTPVIRAITEFYRDYPINSHSDDSRLGEIIAAKIKEARALVAALVEAKPNEVMFTTGTTDSLNKVALMLDHKVKANDEVLISYYNHASAVLPFIALAKRVGAKIVYAADVSKAITPATKLIVAAPLNNTIQSDLNWSALYKKSRANKAILINDAAQALAHMPVSLKEADIIVFSSNKIYGPTGSGGMVIREELLKTLKPAILGGGSIDQINGTEVTYMPAPDGFEPGTLNTAGILGLGAAIKYFNSAKNLHAHEQEVANYAHAELSKVPNIRFYTRPGDSIIIFNIGKFNPQDVVSYLGHHDIILRGGLHCAKLLDKVIKYEDSARVSIAGYNNKKDIDTLIAALYKGISTKFLDFV